MEHMIYIPQTLQIGQEIVNITDLTNDTHTIDIIPIELTLYYNFFY